MPSDITGTDVLEEDRATGQALVQVRQGPDLRQPPAGRRDQPHAAQDPGGAAAGHAGAPGHRRRATTPLPPPFLVFATQNPIEQEGTYPLPEAQLDRFMFMIDVGYPSADEEIEIVRMETSAYHADVQRLLSPERISQMQDLVRRVPVADHVVKYAVALARATRPKVAGAPAVVRDYVAWGAGPRASQFLVLAAKSRAVLDGRFAVSVDDIAALARPTLQHRLILNYRAEAEGLRAADIVLRLLAAVPA
jgi:MoxR-like ATPase